MSIRQTKSGRWEARLMIDGQRHQATHPTAVEAEDWVATTRARNTLGGLPARGTVGAYAALWLATYDDAPANTRAFHDINWRVHLRGEFGHAKIADVTPTQVTTVLNRIRRTKSAATADSCYRTLHALMRSAEADDVVIKSPVRAKRHRPRRQKEPVRFLEKADARRLILQLQDWQRDTALIQLSFGARVGEIAALTAHDVDLDRGTVTIRRRYDRRHRTVRATKNHRLRTLEIPRTARAALARLVELHGDQPPIPRLEDREWPSDPWMGRWLIQTSTGRPADYGQVNSVLAAAAATLDLAAGVTTHVLRHTYVSWQIDAGHTAEQIAFWIGDTPETVRQVYAHMLEDSSKPAADTIDAAMHGIS